MILRLSRLPLASIALLLSLAAASASTLEQVKMRGYLVCGASGGLAGFARLDEQTGQWSGFDIDFCRALAAAIFDDPSLVEVVALTAKDRVRALLTTEVDRIDARRRPGPCRATRGRGSPSPPSPSSTARAFSRRASAPCSRGAISPASRSCVQQGTPLELDLVDNRRAGEKPVEPRLFPSFEEAAKAYATGGCDALTADLSTLAGARARLEAPAEHAILGELIDKEPLGPVVRQGDDQWFDIVRWVHFGMVDAEELGVASANVDEALKSPDPQVRRLLGVDGGRIDGFGLEPDWVYRIVKHVGNYGEVFERHLGHGSPLALDRRLNALWTKGGLMYAPPVR